MANTQNPSRTFFMLLIACATVGLAPFTPEPHIWANLKWIAGGAHGMELMNWLDTLFHGTPWLITLLYGIYVLKNKISGETEQN